MNHYIPVEEKNIKIYGRTSNQTPLPLFWTGSGVECKADGSELWFEIETNDSLYEQWIRIEINGYSMIRMPLEKGKSRICAFRGMLKEVVKNVKLIKEVQPMRIDPENRFLIHSVIGDGKLYPIKKHSCRLEFIGDSITSGEGMAGSKETCEWVSMIFSTDGNYAMQTAYNLKADYRILSQSGWGVYSAWDNARDCTMTACYSQICGVIQGEQNEALGALEENDFSVWKPNVIIVNLGTNDGSAFDHPAWIDPNTGIAYQQIKNADGSHEKESVNRFTNAVYEFLKKLRRYNRESHLLWAYGMINHDMEEYIKNAIAIYQEETKDNNVSYLSLPELKEDWIGANNHPGILSHAKAAEVLTEEINKILEGKANHSKP